MEFTKYAKDAMDVLKTKGAFLTVKSGDKVNTMTIGWGDIGYIWRKPVFMVMVRKSRHTYDIIEAAEDFTVSIPVNCDLKKELAICGTKSGRDIDKFKECNLSMENSNKVNSPIIGECDLQFECKIIYKQHMDEKFLSSEINKSCYENGDYHTMYYGEIVDCYLK